MQSTEQAHRWSYISFVASSIAMIAALIDVARRHISPLATLGKTTLPLGLFVFSISLLVRPRSERAANVLLVLTFVLYAVFLAVLFGNRP